MGYGGGARCGSLCKHHEAHSLFRGQRHNARSTPPHPPNHPPASMYTFALGPPHFATERYTSSAHH